MTRSFPWQLLLVQTLALVGGCAVGCGHDGCLSTVPPPGVPNEEVVSSTLVDAFPIDAVTQADVLLVIETSPLTADTVDAFADELGALIAALEETPADFHLGVVATDMNTPDSRGRLIEVDGALWADQDMADPTGWVQRVVAGRGAGTWDNRGLESTYLALEGFTEEHQGFLREESALHVIVVSDQDDHNTQLTHLELADFLGELGQTHRGVAFSSVVSPDASCATGLEPGERYQLLTDTVGGASWSLCDDRWDLAAEALAEAHPTGNPREFALRQLADSSTLEVAVWRPDLSPLDVDDFRYDPVRNSVVLEPYWVLAPGTVKVTYEAL